MRNSFDVLYTRRVLGSSARTTAIRRTESSKSRSFCANDGGRPIGGMGMRSVGQRVKTFLILTCVPTRITRPLPFRCPPSCNHPRAIWLSPLAHSPIPKTFTGCVLEFCKGVSAMHYGSVICFLVWGNDTRRATICLEARMPPPRLQLLARVYVWSGWQPAILSMLCSLPTLPASVAIGKIQGLTRTPRSQDFKTLFSTCTCTQ
ncbi:hypothetical protein BDZ88DRAFT_9567 [Geranomyces variabilis]|nr:hypothetical protein BDZ88DRAFT_9567 [Geranomyces variabilis]